MKKVFFLTVYFFLSVTGFVQFDIDEELHQILDQHRLESIRKLLHPMAKSELRRMVFFDRILGSNKDNSHTTCHHPRSRHVESPSLSIDMVERGLGKSRALTEGGEWVFPKAPKIFNRGAEASIPCFGTATCLAH
jgi:hypothetical protein